MKKLSDAIQERDKKIKSFLALNEEQSATHYMEPKMGQYGKIVVLESPAADMLAEIMGIPDGWRLVKVVTAKAGDNMDNWAGMERSAFAAYNSGDRLTFFEDEKDYTPDAE